uniref:Superoxide dismutase [Cu-Zn] n=1 Tax=Bursaphelenchus mucronatus TaxID=6325 RepID=A0A2H4GBT4_BURMU|nr:extracellular superoxide dismutase [Bursaphelenchus mucronatus]
MKSVVFVLLLLNHLTDAEKLTASVDVLRAGEKTPGEKIGTLNLVQEDGKLKITGKLSGLPPGQHGFHIHEKSDLTNNCLNTGGHFNPFEKDHGAPSDEERHAGDLGNILVKDDGTVDIAVEDHLASLEGNTNVLNHAVVVHEKADDLGKGGDAGSKKTGNAGSRLACGVIASGSGVVVISIGITLISFFTVKLLR